MAAPSPRLAALKALLTSARELAQTLESDPTLRRVLRALACLPPEDREILANALERGAASRRINDAFASLNGVRLRVNPNPRLYLRVVDGATPATAELDEEDIVPDIFLLMRRLPLLLAPQAQAAWHPALRSALEMLTAPQRETCLRFVDDVRALLVASAGESDGEPES
jgi:hypothetical protein